MGHCIENTMKNTTKCDVSEVEKAMKKHMFNTRYN